MFGVNHVWLSSERIVRKLLGAERSIHISDRPPIGNVNNTNESGDCLPLLGHNGTVKLFFMLSVFGSKL